MKFKDIKITGISTSLFGVSWEPTKRDRDIAKKDLHLS